MMRRRQRENKTYAKEKWKWQKRWLLFFYSLLSINKYVEYMWRPQKSKRKETSWYIIIANSIIIIIWLAHEKKVKTAQWLQVKYPVVSEVLCEWMRNDHTTKATTSIYMKIYARVRFHPATSHRCSCDDDVDQKSTVFSYRQRCI